MGTEKTEGEILTGLSERSIRRMVAERLPGRKVSDDAVKLLRSSLEQTAHYIIANAAQQHDHENLVRKQIGERPRVRLSAKHIRIALGAESDRGLNGHA